MYSEILSSYNLIIICSIIIIISFFFGEISKRTGVPSVLLLIVLGILLQFVLDFFNIYNLDFFPVLEMLGIVGLIMIVLEAALELKLDRDKIKPITSAFLVALIGLLGSAFLTVKVLMHFIPTLTTMQAWMYATPLSILSSAIIIPSVSNLRADKKEFHIYESTFSDIMGIMLFYFITAQLKSKSLAIAHHKQYSFSSGVVEYSINIFITILLSIIFSYIIVLVFQKLQSQVKLFLLIALLMLLYAIGKQMHLSSLLIILSFGLVIANTELFLEAN
ncbi:MAG: cation:proton antiporter [Chitinophagales bacterium]